jgi:hypothetical protein
MDYDRAVWQVPRELAFVKFRAVRGTPNRIPPRILWLAICGYTLAQQLLPFLNRQVGRALFL